MMRIVRKRYSRAAGWRRPSGHGRSSCVELVGQNETIFSRFAKSVKCKYQHTHKSPLIFSQRRVHLWTGGLHQPKHSVEVKYALHFQFKCALTHPIAYNVQTQSPSWTGGNIFKKNDLKCAITRSQKLDKKERKMRTVANVLVRMWWSNRFEFEYPLHSWMWHWKWFIGARE